MTMNIAARLTLHNQQFNAAAKQSAATLQTLGQTQVGFAANMRKSMDDMFGGKGMAAQYLPSLVAANQGYIDKYKSQLMGMGTMMKAAAVGGPVYMAAQFEQEMTGVRKVTGDSWSEMKEMGQGILEITRRLPSNANELARGAAAAARFGIRGKTEILAFTELAAKAKLAWDGVNEALAGEVLARAGSTFFSGKSVAERTKGILSMADAVNFLGNSFATSHLEIVKFMQGRAMAQAKTIGMNERHLLAYGTAALVTSSPSGMLNATQAASTLRRLSMAVNKGATKKQREGMSALGYGKGELKGLIDKNPMDAILDLVERVRKIAGTDKTKATSLLTQIVGDARAAAQLTGMVSNINELKRALSGIDDDYRKRFLKDKEFVSWMEKSYPHMLKQLRDAKDSIHLGSVDQEVKRLMESTWNHVKVMGNAMKEFLILFAEPLMEPLRKISSYVQKTFMWLSDWTKQNPKTAGMIAKMAVGLLALKTALIAGALAAAVARGALLKWAARMAGAGALLTSGPWVRLIGWLRWLAFTPWGLAAAASFAALANNMKALGTIASTAWQGFSKGWTDYFSNPEQVQGMKDLSKAWNDFSAAFRDLTTIDMGQINLQSWRDLWETLGGAAAKAVAGTIWAITKALQALAAVMKGDWQGLKELFGIQRSAGLAGAGPGTTEAGYKGAGAAGGAVPVKVVPGSSTPPGQVNRFGFGAGMARTGSVTQNISMTINMGAADPKAVASAVNAAMKQAGRSALQDNGAQ